MYLGVLDDGTVKGFPLTEAQVRVCVFSRAHNSKFTWQNPDKTVRSG